MALASASRRKWDPTPYAGVQLCGLHRNHTNGGSVLVSFAPGARFPRHDHPDGEEVLVVKGKIQIGEHVLSEGDYLWTPPGGIHDARAIEETVLFISSPAGIQILE